MSGIVEAGEVTEFSQYGDSDREWHPPQGLEGGDDGMKPPGFDLFVEFLLQTLQTFGVLGDGSDIFLENNVLGGGRTDHLAEPSEVGRTPGGPADVPDAMPEQEGFEPQFGRFEITDGVFTRTSEVADRFILHGGDIDGGQITRAHQPRQLHGVTAVGVYAVAGLFRNQGGSHNPANQVLLREITLEPGPAGARFIDKDQVFSLGLHLLNELINVGLPGADGAQVEDLSVVLLGDRGHGDGILVDIQPNRECASMRHG